MYESNHLTNFPTLRPSLFSPDPRTLHEFMKNIPFDSSKNCTTAESSSVRDTAIWASSNSSSWFLIFLETSLNRLDLRFDKSLFHAIVEWMNVKMPRLYSEVDKNHNFLINLLTNISIGLFVFRKIRKSAKIGNNRLCLPVICNERKRLNLPITPSQRPKCINSSSAHCNSSAWMDDWGSTPIEFRLPSDIAFCRFLVMSAAVLSVCTSRPTITLPCVSEVTYCSQVSNWNTLSVKKNRSKK